MSEKVMLQHMGRIYVGEPVNEFVEGAEVLVEIKNAYEFIPVTTLIPKGNDFGVLSAFSIFKIGAIINIPESAILVELEEDSPYYLEYVKVTSNINVVPANERIFKR